MARNIYRSSESSDSNEDLIGAVAGSLSKLKLPNRRHFRCQVSTFEQNIDHVYSERAFADSKKASKEDALLFNPATVPKDERDEMLEMFLETSAPSKVKRSEGVGQIRILSLSYDVEGLGDLGKLYADWEKLLESGQTIDMGAVKKLAISNSCLGGIWLLFFETGTDADVWWEKIARATVNDELGSHAKVTPCEDVGEKKDLHGSHHVVSVYTQDFTNKENVMKVEGAIRGLGFRKHIVFKPRVYSAVGVYASNKWNLQPSFYTSFWDDSKNAGNIQDRTGPCVTYMVNYQGGKK